MTASEIGLLLEDRIPILSRVVGDRDFRPGHGGEEIVSGLMIPVDKTPGDERLRFKCLFGALHKADQAIACLAMAGIEARRGEAASNHIPRAIYFEVTKDSLELLKHLKIEASTEDESGLVK